MMSGKSLIERYAPAGQLPGWVLFLLIPAGIVLIGLAVWIPLIQRSAEFWFDDYDLLVSTYIGLHDFSLTQLLPWTPAHRPLGRNLFALMLLVFGENPVAFHWTQLSLHCVNAVLLWFLLLALTREWLPAFAGSIVFLLSLSAYHPINWSGSIFDVASATFILAAMLMVVHSLDRRYLRRPWLFFGALPVYLLALKTKESLLVFPAVVFLYFLFHGSLGILLLRHARKLFGREPAPDPHPRGNPRAEIIWMAVASLVTVTFYLTANIHTTYSQQPTDPYYVVWSLPVSLKSFGFYLSTLFYQGQEFGFFLTVQLLLLPVCLAVVMWERNLVFGLAWYGLFLLPLSLLVNHYRFLYYPYVAVAGVAIGLAVLFKLGNTPAYIPRKIWGVLPVLFLMVFIPYAARHIHTHPFVQWHEQVHLENRKTLLAMKAALPAPAPDAEILLVIPTLNVFSHNPSSVLQVMYGDLSLTGRLFESAEEAREYLTGGPTDRPRILVTWKDETFHVTPSMVQRRGPPDDPG